MSRSRQALRLASHLSEITCVRVALVYASGATWDLQWPDGPTNAQMRARLDQALAGHHFPHMRDRTLHLYRATSSRAWAARAIASRREGTLTPAITEGVARHHGLPVPRLGITSTLPPAHYAVLEHIEHLIATTPYPERASAPEDEPLIEQLLAAAGSGGSENAMTRILLNAERAPQNGEPRRLRAVPDP